MENRPHSRSADRLGGDTVDELIRRRFRTCETLPLFPERVSSPTSARGLPGFFQDAEIGRQLRLTELSSR